MPVHKITAVKLITSDILLRGKTLRRENIYTIRKQTTECMNELSLERTTPLPSARNQCQHILLDGY
jgi:hypothetical protein